MRFARSLALLAAPVLLAVAPRASVLVVGPSGPFADVASAVAAAADGDTLLVETGTYGAVTIDSKSLTVVADEGATVVLEGETAVANLALGELVVLAGITFRATGARALVGSANQGTLRLQACAVVAQSASPGCALRDGAVFTGCDDLALEGSSFLGGDQPSGGAASCPGGVGLRLASSRAALYDCLVRGGRGGADLGAACGPSCPSGGPGGDAAVAVGSFVFAANTGFQGGAGAHGVDASGGCLGTLASNGGPGGDGYVQTDAGGTWPARLVRIASTFVAGAGGAGGTDDAWPCAGPGGDGPSGQGLVVLAGVDEPLDGARRRMFSPVVARELASVPLTFRGEPGDQVTLLVGTTPLWRYRANARGVALVGVPLLQSIVAGTIPGSGLLQTQLALPDLGAGVESRTWFLQALMRDAGGQLFLGSAGSLVILDQQF